MSAPKASIVFVTHRANPRFEWFADSLAAQLGDGAEAELIVVDGLHSQSRERELARIVAGRFALRHVAPKPTPYSGPRRMTSRDYNSVSSARNTGIVFARAPYVVFTDDSGVLVDGWWQEVQDAASLGYVLAGSYENRLNMRVERGRLLGDDGTGGASRLGAIDSRWETGDEQALVQIVGTQLFGCGFGAPRALLVAVNGFDELCDPIGGEDGNLGVRLEWSGARIFYSRRMKTIKDGERHRDDAVVRLDRGHSDGVPLEESQYMDCLERFGVGARTIADAAWDCGHLCLDLLYGTRSVRALGNDYDLATLTEAELEQTATGFAERYWATGEPLAEL
jgi:hypothetical protein